jgi:exo-beta-1,3-glucanase (GH17 family)
MNERIRELAEQAGVIPGIMGLNRFTYFDTEKFAELIVRECVRYFNEDYQRDFDTLWREDLSKGIKEHFGVES